MRGHKILGLPNHQSAEARFRYKVAVGHVASIHSFRRGDSPTKHRQFREGVYLKNGVAGLPMISLSPKLTPDHVFPGAIGLPPLRSWNSTATSDTQLQGLSLCPETCNMGCPSNHRLLTLIATTILTRFPATDSIMQPDPFIDGFSIFVRRFPSTIENLAGMHLHGTK